MSRRNESFVAHPRARALVARPVGRTGEVQAQVAHRPDQRVVLEQRAILLQRPLEIGRLVRRAEAAPGDEVRTGRDGRRRVDLEQGQPRHDSEQVGRPWCVEKLRAHRDASGLRFGEPVHGQEATSGLLEDVETEMSDAILYLDTSDVREGALEELKPAMARLVEFVKANEPQLIAYNVYFTEDGTR